jgi:hypothetical protein
MNELPVITQVEKVRRAHCTYCEGKGSDMQFEWVKSPLGTSYRIPLSHTQCKQSVLSLSLSLSMSPL